MTAEPRRKMRNPLYLDHSEGAACEHQGCVPVEPAAETHSQVQMPDPADTMATLAWWVGRAETTRLRAEAAEAGSTEAAVEVDQLQRRIDGQGQKLRRMSALLSHAESKWVRYKNLSDQQKLQLQDEHLRRLTAEAELHAIQELHVP